VHGSVRTMVGQHSRPVSIAARSLRQNSSSCFWRRAIASTLPSSMTRFRFDMVPPPTIRAGDALTRQRSRESAFVILMFWSFPHPKHIKQCGRFRGSSTALMHCPLVVQDRGFEAQRQ